MKRRYVLRNLRDENQAILLILKRGGHIMYWGNELLVNISKRTQAEMDRHSRRLAHKANRKRYTT